MQGIVANAPLEDGEGVRVYLDALLRIGKGADGKPLVKGVRRLIQSESTKFCVHPSFVNGVKVSNILINLLIVVDVFISCWQTMDFHLIFAVVHNIWRMLYY